MDFWEAVFWVIGVFLIVYTFRKQWRALNNKQVEKYPLVSLTVIANIIHFAPQTPHEKNIVINKIAVAVLIAVGFITGWLWIFSILSLIVIVWHLDWYNEDEKDQA